MPWSFSPKIKFTPTSQSFWKDRRQFSLSSVKILTHSVAGPLSVSSTAQWELEVHICFVNWPCRLRRWLNWIILVYPAKGYRPPVGEEKVFLNSLMVPAWAWKLNWQKDKLMGEKLTDFRDFFTCAWELSQENEDPKWPEQEAFIPFRQRNDKICEELTRQSDLGYRLWMARK